MCYVLNLPKYLNLGGGVKSVSLFWCNIFLPEELTSGFPGGSVVNNPPVDEGDTRDMSLIPGSGRSPGGGNGNPLRYSCLGNPMDRGAWWATGVRHDLVTRQQLELTSEGHKSSEIENINFGVMVRLSLSGAIWSWECYAITLHFKFLICEMGIIIVLMEMEVMLLPHGSRHDS